MTDPTPAPTAPLTVADFERRKALVDDTFPHTYGVTPPLVMHRRGRLMVRLVEFQREVERQAIARHREQADAEMARLKATVEEALADLHGLSEMVHPDPARPGIGVRMVAIAAVRTRIRAALATLPPTSSPEQGVEA